MLEDLESSCIKIGETIYDTLASEEMVSTPLFWAKVFDSFYEKISDQQNAPLDTSVWRNSYDGSVFPKEEMDDWITNAINKLKTKITPQSRILEIGCGNGIIFSRLIHDVATYTGTDIAPAALSSIAKSLDGRLYAEKIKLYEVAANKISSIGGEYDIVIINSVAQYFPDLNYFFDVLDGIESILAKDGVCFLGDIRSKELSDVFYEEVAKTKFQSDDKKAKEHSARLKKRDNETLYSKNFFSDLRYVYPWMKSVVISDKISQFSNEMSRFRFDVMISKSGQEQSKPKLSEISSYSNHISEHISKRQMKGLDYAVVSLHQKLFKLVQLYAQTKH